MRCTCARSPAEHWGNLPNQHFPGHVPAMASALFIQGNPSKIRLRKGFQEQQGQGQVVHHIP
jgi:hypothetical protein